MNRRGLAHLIAVNRGLISMRRRPVIRMARQQRTSVGLVYSIAVVVFGMAFSIYDKNYGLTATKRDFYELQLAMYDELIAKARNGELSKEQKEVVRKFAGEEY